MKSILKALYNGKINEAEKPLKNLSNTEEYKEYIESMDKLIDTLTKEQERLFNEAYFAQGGFDGLVYERIYANAFKTGFWLAMELIDVNDLELY